MKSFAAYITEIGGSFRRKGWVNIKSGKMVLWAFRGRTIRPFHSEYVLNNVNKFFRGGEDRLLTTFANAFGFEPDEMEAQSLWNDLKSGKVDRDSNLDSIMNEAGWRRVVFDEGISSIEANSPQDARKALNIVLKNVKWDEIQSLYIFDKGHLNDPTEIYNPEDAAIYAKTGRLPKRTEIGRTMAMFRDHIELEESYKGESLIGWLDPKDKLHLYPQGGRMGKYHTMILTRIMTQEEFRKFQPNRIGVGIAQDMISFVRSGNMTEKELKHIIDKTYESNYKRLKTGKDDGDYDTEEAFMNAGWVKIRIDRRSGGFSSLLSNRDAKRNLACAKILDKKLGGWPGVAGGSFIVDDQPTKIQDSKTWETYLKTGKIPKRTEIGSTMARFREWVEFNEEVDRDDFRKHWKKAPVMKTGATDVKKRNAHWDSYFKHFEDKYGEIPKRVKDAMRTADYKPNPSVTYKGRKFKLRTGMDEMDLLYHVLSEGWSDKYKRSIDCKNPKGFSQRAHCQGRTK